MPQHNSGEHRTTHNRRNWRGPGLGALISASIVAFSQ